MWTVRIFYALTGLEPVQLYSGGELIQDGIVNNFAATFEVPDKKFEFELRHQNNVLLARTVKLETQHSVLIIARPKGSTKQDQINPFLISDRVECPAPEHAKFRIIHAASLAQGLVQVNKAVLGAGPSTPYQEVVKLDYRTVSTYVEVNVNKVYSFQVTDPETQKIIYVTQNPVSFSAGFIYDFVITGDPSTDDSITGLHLDVLSTNMCAPKS